MILSFECPALPIETPKTPDVSKQHVFTPELETIQELFSLPTNSD
jgi:hypothetical protein